MITVEKVWKVLMEQDWAVDLDGSVLKGLSAADLLDVLAYRYFIPDRQLLDFCCAFDSIEPGDDRLLIPDPDSVNAGDSMAGSVQRWVPVFRVNGTLGVVTDNPFRAAEQLGEDGDQLIRFLCVTPSAFDRLVSGDAVKDVSREDVFKILRAAYEKGATDIHFFSNKTGIKVMFRLNQRLVHYDEYGVLKAGCIRRLLKFESNMDGSNQWIAQDGAMQISVSHQKLDIRVATYPSIYGEDFVCRLLYRTNDIRGLEDLGCSQGAYEALQDMLMIESGLVFVNGPTGAGKTTTIYACLKEWRNRGKHVITIEDPVEIRVDGIRQASVNMRAGFGFEAALKGILRQDPDIILIGEIRNSEVAQLALQLAYSGHIVIASFHAGSIHDTLMRLSSFQLDSFLLWHCLRWVFCQKLVLNACDNCGSINRAIDDSIGCDACDWTGYLGVRPIMEFGEMNASFDATRFTVSDFLTAIKQNRYGLMCDHSK